MAAFEDERLACSCKPFALAGQSEHILFAAAEVCQGRSSLERWCPKLGLAAGRVAGRANLPPPSAPGNLERQAWDTWHARHVRMEACGKCRAHVGRASGRWRRGPWEGSCRQHACLDLLTVGESVQIHVRGYFTVQDLLVVSRCCCRSESGGRRTRGDKAGRADGRTGGRAGRQDYFLNSECVVGLLRGGPELLAEFWTRSDSGPWTSTGRSFELVSIRGLGFVPG